MGGLVAWRRQVRAVTRDQGTEKGIESAPVGDAVKEVVSALKAGDPQLSGALADEPHCFPFALEIPEHLHFVWNALEEA